MANVSGCPHQTDVHLELAPMSKDRGEGWRYFRDAGPVFQDTTGTWYITSADLIRDILRRPDVFSSAQGAFDASGCPVPMIPVSVDPPDHVVYRRALDPMFAPRVLTPMEPELRRQARELISAFADKGKAEVMADLAKLFPTQVFLTLFGLPLSDRDQLITWVRGIQEETDLTGGGTSARQKAISDAMTAYLNAAIAEKRANPKDDMLSHVLQIPHDEHWNDTTILGFSYLFMLGGLDTVTAAIGYAMRYLATHPKERQSVRDEPECVPSFVEEMLRLESGTPLLPRDTTEDVDVGGVKIPAGSRIILAFGAANRDPERYPNPDQVDLSQAETGHLTFGGGVHRCIGAHLARRELRIVIEEFHKLIPDYELAPGFEATVDWPGATMVFSELPIVFPVRAPA